MKRLLLLLAPLLRAADFDQQIADLGSCPTVGGIAIQPCKLGYRTAGQLNAARSNAILFPTWFSGKTENLRANIGPGKMVDTDRFFVIAVDALGNGISSAPSNTPGFPHITIADMVRAQHKFLTEKLNVTRLHAVMGISMGGMQTFEWISAYPAFAERAVPIIGSPKLTAPDLLLWQAQLSVIEAAEKSGADLREAMKGVMAMHQFALQTPEYRRTSTSPADWPKFKQSYEAGIATGMHPLDWASQLRAMMSQDVFARHGSLDQASAAVRARTLVVVATQDHMVNPQPAIDWARHAGFPLLKLTGACGHMATSCEAARYQDAVKRFLENK
jgi:homoserine O-acetyltransferase/O-succinyltransferase